MYIHTYKYIVYIVPYFSAETLCKVQSGLFPRSVFILEAPVQVPL